jgi:chemotaxis protein CheD
MTAFATSMPAPETTVGMGQIAAGRTPQRLKAILGSCIGLILYHPRLKTGVMAHIVLPDSAGRDGPPGKFADTAVPGMLELLKGLGTPAHGLTAKLAGGGKMFKGSGPLQVGDANAEAAFQALRSAGIRIEGQDLGGTRGRRVTFDCESGALTVEQAGQSARTI